MKNLVILPGWTRSIKTYKRLIDSAPKDLKITVVNYKDIIPDANAESFAENFDKYLRENNLSKITLVGHSLGGVLAIKYVIKYSNKVEKLYLVDSKGIYGGETHIQIANNLIRSLFSRGRSKVTALFVNSSGLFSNMSLHLKLGYFAYKADLSSYLSSIKLPTTILWGEKDIVTPLWQGEILHKSIKNSKLVVVKNEGHDWLAYAPVHFWENIS